MNLLLKQARRLIILIVGGTVVLIGLILLVTPGPAFVVIPIGLAILATEFVWARRLLLRVKKETESALRGEWRGRGGNKSDANDCGVDEHE